MTERGVRTTVDVRSVVRARTLDRDLGRDVRRVAVRAVERDGTVQSSERTDPYPSGASGWVGRTVGDA